MTDANWKQLYEEAVNRDLRNAVERFAASVVDCEWPASKINVLVTGDRFWETLKSAFPGKRPDEANRKIWIEGITFERMTE